MLERMEKGEATGILAWHPDRLARNSVDGGKIIYLVDTGVISEMKFPTFWFDPTPQGKFMLSIAFSQSKYYVDNFSENIKRGHRNKVKIGGGNGIRTHVPISRRVAFQASRIDHSRIPPGAKYNSFILTLKLDI